MARTLVGRLQLIVQAMGLSEAKKVEGSIGAIEQAAKRLSSAAWGQSFQRQLEKLALGAQELDQVRKSWNALERDIASRGLTAALRKSEISAWKTSTVGHFASIRSSAQRANNEMDRTLRIMRRLGRAGLAAGGIYGAGYGIHIAGRAAMTAGSEERRVAAEAKFAGLSEDERSKIDTRSNTLAGKYRLNKSQVYDMMKEASLAMPSTDAALAVSEEMARALLVFSNMFGSDNALTGLRQFNKGMDNIEQVTPDEYRYMLENYTKAQQVVGKDMDPTAFYEALKYSRTSGKVFSPEFLSQWLPMLIAESGGSDSGTQLRAMFDQFIVGRASKKALAQQRSYGLRDDDGRLLDQEGFGKNPLTWIYDVLVPQLKKKGVDTEDEIELARVIGELTNNRLSSDMVTRGIISFEQYRRLVEERLPNAAGLSAADDVQNLNPFAALEGFQSSLRNLSAAVLPMETVGAGLNNLADYINSFTERVRASDPRIMTGVGIVGAGVAAIGAWKVTAGIWGLITAGTNLNVAAAALQAAAASQMGGGLPDGKTGAAAGRSGGFLAALGLTGATGAWASLVQGMGNTPGDTFGAQVQNQALARQGLQRMLGIGGGPSHGQERERDSSLNGFMRTGPGGPGGPGGMHAVLGAEGTFDRMLAGMDKVRQEAQSVANDASSALSFNAKPTVDQSSVAALEATVDRILGKVRSIGAAAAAANSGIDHQLRRSFTDYGVAP